MVGIIGELNSRSGKLGDLLGSALGQGLSNFTNSYYANKDLDKVLNDKSLEGASTEKKLSALERALAPHGDVGKNLLKDRFAIEEQGFKERKAKQESDLDKRKIALEEKKLGEKEGNDKSTLERKEKLENFQGAIDSVTKMRDLRKKNNLGFGSSVTGLINPEVRKDRGEYETLGNSLISYASNIPIRNKLEFEKLAGRISDPSITDSEAEGILDALESIITNSIKSYTNPKDIKPLDLQTMQDIYKKSGGDKDKAKKLAIQMGYNV